MRNEQAARYARRSAMAAGLVVLVVVGVYAYRAYERLRLRKLIPALVSTIIQQSSADFTYSQVEQGRTIFKIRASHATQFKDQNRAELDDVWITVYGREGNRNDNIHTRQCSYEPPSGAIRCVGEVRIDLQSAQPAKPSGNRIASPAADSFHLTTSDLSFNRQTGEASTTQPIFFQFAGGQARGAGLSYSASDAVIRVPSGVEFDLNPSANTQNLPVMATGSSLEIHRNERIIVLNGPAKVTQGPRQLVADKITVMLDKDYYAQSASAQGHAVLTGNENGRELLVSADQFDGTLGSDGGLKSLSADGNIAGRAHSLARNSTFSAAHLAIALDPEHNSPQSLLASGVTAESNQNGASQTLQTASLRLTFAPASGSKSQSKGSSAPAQIPVHIESAETLAPATIESQDASESTTLQAQKFVAKLGANSHLDQLLGHGDVHVERTPQKSAPQKSSADELAVTFDPSGQWQTIDETGDVRLQQEDRVAIAAEAKVDRGTGEVALDGFPVISDAVSRTTAVAVSFNQTTGEFRATGGVASTYMPSSGNAQTQPLSFGSGVAHITADSASGSTQTGHVTYSGHARLWQGEAILNADQIEVWRVDKKMTASGNVFAVFPQQAGGFALPDSLAKEKTAAKPSAVSLWKVRAPLLTYWNDQEKARLEGGVLATSQDESLQSHTLDIFLGPAAGASAQHSNAAIPGLSTTREVSRIVAQGNVIVKQADRQGTAEKAEYTAADQKFVLSGGQPTLTNSSRDTTSGHSLTFYVANDTILIDSQTGSRTLTRHRVEK